MNLIKQYCVAIHAGVEVGIVKLYKSVGSPPPATFEEIAGVRQPNTDPSLCASRSKYGLSRLGVFCRA